MRGVLIILVLFLFCFYGYANDSRIRSKEERKREAGLFLKECGVCCFRNLEHRKTCVVVLSLQAPPCFFKYRVIRYSMNVRIVT